MSTLEQLITSGIEPQAYLGHNDLIAAGIIRALRELDIKVPDEAGVIGINGDEIGEICYP